MLDEHIGHSLGSIKEGQVALPDLACHDRALAHPVKIERVLYDHGLLHLNHHVIDDRQVFIQKTLGEAHVRPEFSPEQLAPSRVCVTLVQEHPADGLLCVQRLAGKVSALLRDFFFGKTNMIADRHIRLRPYAGGPQMGDGHGRNRVVTVQKIQKRARAGCNASVTGIRKTAVFLMDHFYTGVLQSQLITDFTASVCRAVIDEDDLQIAEGLREDCVRAHLQIWLHIIDRDDHGDQILCAFHTNSHIFPFTFVTMGGRPGHIRSCGRLPAVHSLFRSMPEHFCAQASSRRNS